MFAKLTSFFTKTIGKQLLWSLLVLSVLCEFVKATALLFPFAIEKFVNEIQSGVYSLYYPKLLFAAYLVIFVLQSIIIWFYGKIQIKTKVKLQISIFDNLLKLNPSEIKRRGEGFYTSLMERFVDTVLNILSPSSVSIFFKILEIAVILGILYNKNILIGSVCTILVALYIIAFVLNNKLFSTVLMEYLEKNSEGISKIYDFIKGNKSLLSNKDYQDFAHDRVDKILIKAQLIEFKLQYFFELIFSTLINFIQPCMNLLIMLIMGKNVVDGQLSFGSFILIITYYNILQSNVKCFQSAADLLFHTNGALDNLNEFIDEDKLIIASGCVKDGDDFFLNFDKTSLKLENEIIFNESSIKLEKGYNYGLIGFSGAGKSSFINLIIGLSKPNGGSVEFLKKNQNCSDVIAMQKIAILSQQTEIFNLSLEENIFLTDNYDKEEYNMLVNEFDLKNLTNRSLGSEGSFVSGGEKQKVLLARFVHQLKELEYYILDEPFTGMDIVTKKSMIKKISPIIKRKTGICITHDQLVLDSLCDKVIAIDNNYKIVNTDDTVSIEKILLSFVS